MAVQIRELKGKDVRTVVGMLKHLTPEARKTIADIMKGGISGKGSKVSESKAMETGLAIFQVVSELTDEIYAWLADIAGMTSQELDDAPASTVIDIVKALSLSGGIASFFGSVLQSSKKE